jgi:hypothetical protein
MNHINPSSSPSSFYGCCIRTLDNILVIGARCGSPYDPVGPGFVEIYQDGVLAQTIHGTQHGERFGVAIEINEQYLCIGAYRQGTRALNGGSVYIYTKHNNEYVFDHLVYAEDKSEKDYFGYNISLCNDQLAIGAYAKDIVGGEDGKVYLYNLKHKTFTNAFCRNSPIKDENFGRFVHLDNDKLYVSAHKSNNVDIYTNNELSGSICAPENAKGFGNSIYTYKDYVVIGAYSTDNVGAVFVYKNYKLIKTLKGNTPNGYFGGSINGHNDKIIIGCYRANENENGSIFLYDLESKELIEHTNPKLSKKHWFGYSVYIDSTNFYVGAVQYNDTGKVYKFKLS